MQGEPAGPGRAAVPVAATTAATLMVLGGEPVGKRFMFWNFVSSRQERIEQAITAELERRGYASDATAPDFLVTYETAVTDKVESSPVRFGIGMGSWGGNVGGSVSVGTPSVQSYQEGELIVRVIDAKTNREAWYGTVSGRVDKSKLDDAAVARAVAIALQDFPARTGAPLP